MSNDGEHVVNIGTRTIVAIFLIPSLLGLALAFGPAVVRHLRTTHILEEGVPATATIVDVVDTGSRVNYDPQVRVLLDVPLEGGETLRTEAVQVLSPVDLVKYQPGKQVQIRYDPESPKSSVLVSKPQ